MEITKFVKDSIKNTVGYSETKNKQAFLDGAAVAFSKSEGYYKARITELEFMLKNSDDNYDRAFGDLRIISDIIQRYSS
jgi:hypothetical protein